MFSLLIREHEQRVGKVGLLLIMWRYRFDMLRNVIFFLVTPRFGCFCCSLSVDVRVIATSDGQFSHKDTDLTPTVIKVAQTTGNNI